jgi:transposase
MPAPLSQDLRKRIIRAREKRDTIKKIACEKDVSVSAVVRLLALYRETGSYEPRPLNNGRKPRLNEETLQLIRERIEKQPDITLKELIEAYSLPVSEAALCKTINNKLGLPRKKNGIRSRAR